MRTRRRRYLRQKRLDMTVVCPPIKYAYLGMKEWSGNGEGC
jgi:hypothetical protein